MKQIFFIISLMLVSTNSYGMSNFDTHSTEPEYGHGAIKRNQPQLATTIIWRSFQRGFWINMLSDNTYTQKIVGNSLAMAYFKFFCKDRSCKTHRSVQAIGYCAGFVAGSLTRCMLNRSLVPWARAALTPQFNLILYPLL